jgi:hypothetical protein
MKRRKFSDKGKMATVYTCHHCGTRVEHALGIEDLRFCSVACLKGWGERRPSPPAREENAEQKHKRRKADLDEIRAELRQLEERVARLENQQQQSRK